MENLDEAEEKLNQMKAASDKRWQKILDSISEKKHNQTTKDKIAWRIELLKRKKLIESI